MASQNPVRCAVIGAGSFGTALAILLAERGCAVELWARDPALATAMNRHRRNPRYLSQYKLPEEIHATESLEDALVDAELVVSVVPSHAVREVWSQAAPFLRDDALLVSGTKGIEVGSGKLMSQVICEVIPEPLHERVIVLAGPSFAREIAEHCPTGVSIACRNEGFAIAAQSMISSPMFRCYSNTDVVGVELGGALKNVIALAVGFVDGVDLGLNARATLITRGLAEMTRLGVRLGAKPVTFQGLSGVGDLVLTCTGQLSRNRQVGLAIGNGRALDEILEGMDEVAEGVRTTRSAWELAQAQRVDMPITEQTFRVLYEGLDPKQAIVNLTTRQLRSEHE
jgi:glycerol-3-phosphate dehydrogenase (NAD(P)+)